MMVFINISIQFQIVTRIRTVSPVNLIRHKEFHIQPTSAGPGTRAHCTHGMPKYAQYFLV
jgi:hypothetical protein